jgi:hypothetical protein
MTEPIDTHGYLMRTGRFKGQRITRVPASSLLGMVRAKHEEADAAAAELDRRGTVIPLVDVSGHAIDRASQLCLKHWRRTRNEGEGMYAWLVRMTLQALKRGHPRGDKIAYDGMLFAIDDTGALPALKTVIRDDRPRPRKDLRPMRVREDDEELAV